MKISTSDIYKVIAKATGLRFNEVSEVMRLFGETLEAAATVGNSVTVSGIGTFKTTMRKARMGRNPKTGAEISIPAKSVLKFSPSASLKTAVAAH